MGIKNKILEKNKKSKKYNFYSNNWWERFLEILEKKDLMENSKIIILAIIGIIIIIIGIGLSLVEESVIENEEIVDEVWHSSGPISIDKTAYNIGEKIFINVENIKPTDKGEAVFLRPIGDDNYKKYLGIKFDGEKFANFNY